MLRLYSGFQKEVIAIQYNVESVGSIPYNTQGIRSVNYEVEKAEPKHFKDENIGTKHYKKVSKKPKILKFIISLELISVIAACCYIYSIWYDGVEALYFKDVCTQTVENISDSSYAQAEGILTGFMESVAEETYEYVWTTDEVKYRKGADKSYKSAGTLDADKMVKRTGITYNGWNRIVVDDKEYYVPASKLTEEIPDSLPIAGGAKGEYQKYALSLLPDFGWDSSELTPLIYLWNRESGWNPSSHNKSSGAHGIPQALPASKMASEGSDYYTNPEPQIRWGLKYIARRYGSPSRAWAHFCSSGWY